MHALFELEPKIVRNRSRVQLAQNSAKHALGDSTSVAGRDIFGCTKTQQRGVISSFVLPCNVGAI